MKKFLVVLLACAMIFGFASTAMAADTQITEFNDIADQSVAARNAIMKLAVLGVIEGNEGVGGAFRPADNLTRAEFAKIVCYLTDNVKLAESLNTVGSKFSDVSTGNWYTGWVNAAAQSGYFVGDPGGSFRPNANITMQEVVTVALRAAGYTDRLGSSTGSTVWPGNYVSKAMSVGLLDDVTFVGSAAASRSDMAIICEAVLGINMVVHISNDIAYALALSDGTVDPDGFSEVYYISNETNRGRTYETILHKAFDGMYYDVQVAQARPTSSVEYDADEEVATISADLRFDETFGWSYEDYASGELAINIAYEDSFIYELDKKFEDRIGYTNNNGNWVDSEYSGTESLAELYYITRDFDLTELAAMQVQVTVIDGKEICFVDVVSDFLYAEEIHQDRSASSNTTAQNIAVDGKNYRASATMGVKGVGSIDDYGVDYYGGWDTDEDEATRLLNLFSSNNDDTFPGKVYLDKDGRIYGVKNYNTYDATSFGIYDKEDSNRVEWKMINGASDDTKLETNKKYTLYKGGEIVKAEDLEENDLVSYLGDNGAPFYLAVATEEGEMTVHNRVNNKLTVDGTARRVINPSNFAYSDDGGETFNGVNLGDSNFEIDFGEVGFAKAYNFSKFGYVASNLTNQKIIGVVTKIEPTQNWNGGVRKERYQEITIFNSEGKEVTYGFTNDFRDGYTHFAAPFFPTVNWLTEASHATKWASANKTNESTSVETLTTALGKGDIVQLVVDKNDKVKRIDNYAKFNVGATHEVKVSSSNSRLTIPSASTTPGTFTMNDDAIVFNVSPDGTSYDDVDLMSVSSVLAKDFDAAKAVAFDVKSGARLNVMYIIGDVSVYQFGVATGKGRDSDGDYYNINGNKVYSDGGSINLPAVVSYKVSGGEASLTSVGLGLGAYLATDSWYYSNVGDLVAAALEGTDRYPKAVVGEAGSYASSTKALQVGSIYVYITSDTYLYDLVEDDDVDVAADLKGKNVMAFFDKDNNAEFVVVLPSSGGTTGTAGNQSDADAVADALADLNAAIGADKELVVAFGTDLTDDVATEAAIILAVEAIVDNDDVVVTAELNDDDKWEVTLTVNNEVRTVVLDDVVVADPTAPVVTGSSVSVDGETITLTFNQAIKDVDDTNVFVYANVTRVNLAPVTGTTAARHATDNTKLVITLGTALENGDYYQVVLNPGAAAGVVGGANNAEYISDVTRFGLSNAQATERALLAAGFGAGDYEVVGNTVTITGDVAADAAITVANGVELVIGDGAELDMNGKALVVNGTVTVGDGGELTVVEADLSGSGELVVEEGGALVLDPKKAIGFDNSYVLHITDGNVTLELVSGDIVITLNGEATLTVDWTIGAGFELVIPTGSELTCATGVAVIEGAGTISGGGTIDGDTLEDYFGW